MEYIQGQAGGRGRIQSIEKQGGFFFRTDDCAPHRTIHQNWALSVPASCRRKRQTNGWQPALSQMGQPSFPLPPPLNPMHACSAGSLGPKDLFRITVKSQADHQRVRVSCDAAPSGSTAAPLLKLNSGSGASALGV